MRHSIKSISILTIILLLIFILGITLFTRIDIAETFETNYIKKSDSHLIVTKDFKIQTPKSWIHISQGYGEEGESIGLFLTPNGKLNYEYGMFANTFGVDSIFVISIDSLRAGKYVIRIARNEKNETGITFFNEDTMKWPFSFFMSKSCTKNLTQLVSGVEQMTFNAEESIK